MNYRVDAAERAPKSVRILHIGKHKLKLACMRGKLLRHVALLVLVARKNKALFGLDVVERVVRGEGRLGASHG